LPCGKESRRVEGVYMELKEGDLVITLPRVDRVKTFASRLAEGLVGVVILTDPRDNNLNVYGVLIDGTVYYLFEDEIKKVEEKC
jgi:hypothetical protein